MTAAIADITDLCSRIVDLTPAIHDTARFLAERYNLAIYDALMIAAALDAECDTLYSEDMHDGLVIEKRLTIRNPFR